MQQQLVNVQSRRIRILTERLGVVLPALKIVDYGCGPGTSAIDAVRPAIEAYRAQFPQSPIAVCHADQPGRVIQGVVERMRIGKERILVLHLRFDEGDHRFLARVGRHAQPKLS